MPAIEEFKQYVDDVFAMVWETQKEKMVRAGEIVADSIAKDGLIHVFGTGHSHLVGEEVMYRAGGIAAVNAILEPSLTGTEHVTKSEFTERMEGWGKIILDYHQPGPDDVMIVVSNSGRNGAPIEVAWEAQKRGLTVIAIVSEKYCRSVTSRHSSGKKLIDVADLILDNCTELGDAAVQLAGMQVPVGPASNISAFFIIHALLVQAIESMLEKGIEPPVYKSGNLDNAREYNKHLIAKYRQRIKVL
ncbi:MAG: SIS domain-containing protein [Halanaerobium sp.]|nr:SIS domain-containing protein [Halanaerobium sp.]